jgi:hypothetical protein
LIVPTPEQIATFQDEHPEPLVEIPAPHIGAYQAGELAVLISPFEAIGFAKNESEALWLLRQRIIDVPAVHQRDVYYYGDGIWPPVEGMAFEPLIGPSVQLIV